MKKRVCITGGTGMIGKVLCRVIEDAGYELKIITRRRNENIRYPVVEWNVSSRGIDIEALRDADHFIHLAGASVAKGRWTYARKKEIRESRINSTQLLYDALKKLDKKPESFVSASAIGVYGHDTGSILVDEERMKPGDDFLATVVKEWESAVDNIGELGIRVVKIRIGVVLSKEGGVLPRLLLPVKYGLGAPLGNGEQYISWIHINDLCRIFLRAVNNDSMKGIYNAVAPNPVTNRELVRAIAHKMRRPLWLPGIPGFVLRSMMGEMASIVLGGNRVSSKKIESTGFEFQYNYIVEALDDLL